MKKHPLLWFFILAFGITWGLAVLYLSVNAIFDNVLGDMSLTHPIFVLAVWGPNIAAVIVVAVSGGWPAVIRLLKKFIPIRISILWYIIAAGLFPLAGILINQISGDPVIFIKLPSREILILAIAILISGPLGEELGWRGYALPRILEKQSAVAAALFLGLIWGLWHLPSFFMSGLPQMGLQIPVFLVAAIAISVIVTWIFVNTNQNVFIAFLLHYALNFTYMLIGSEFLFVAIFQVTFAVLIVVIFGKDLNGIRKKN